MHQTKKLKDYQKNRESKFRKKHKLFLFYNKQEEEELKNKLEWRGSCDTENGIYWWKNIKA